MSLRIIHIATALTGCILLAAGCIRTGALDPAVTTDPPPPGPGTAEAPISFTARTLLLRDDATKGGTPKTDTYFSEGDRLTVYGWHQAAQELITFGTASPVTFGSGGTSCTYAPLKQWDWQGDDDYYDFLALYLGNADRTVTPPGSAPLSAVVSYNAAQAYDLMAASYHRNVKETTPVALQFKHLLCAVRVIVTNSADSKKDGEPFPFTLNYYKYSYLWTEGSVRITGTTQDFDTEYTLTTRSTEPGLGDTPEGGKKLDPGEKSSDAVWDLMLPQSVDPLSTQYLPALVINYTYEENGSPVTKTTRLPLRDILTRDNKKIPEWEAGRKYTYEIEIRLGGGILVHVITSDWETVQAETPGLMI